MSLSSYDRALNIEFIVRSTKKNIEFIGFGKPASGCFLVSLTLWGGFLKCINGLSDWMVYNEFPVYNCCVFNQSSIKCAIAF